jgi:hypothetical protein
MNNERNQVWGPFFAITIIVALLVGIVALSGKLADAREDVDNLRVELAICNGHAQHADRLFAEELEGAGGDLRICEFNLDVRASQFEACQQDKERVELRCGIITIDEIRLDMADWEHCSLYAPGEFGNCMLQIMEGKQIINEP